MTPMTKNECMADTEHGGPPLPQLSLYGHGAWARSSKVQTLHTEALSIPNPGPVHNHQAGKESLIQISQ